MKITLVLASALMAAGCAQAIARHDIFERTDSGIGRVVETAQRMCQRQQPARRLPSAEEYERCVLDALRDAEFTVARQ
jgi:hypothetical protein